jgi:hypothetical protein
VHKVCFDVASPERFLVVESRAWHLYCLHSISLHGASVRHAQCLDPIKGGAPLMLVRGDVVLQLDSGPLSSKTLYSTSVAKQSPESDSSSQIRYRRAHSMTKIQVM